MEKSSIMAVEEHKHCNTQRRGVESVSRAMKLDWQWTSLRGCACASHASDVLGVCIMLTLALLYTD
jgi:hypothetical protein